MNRRAFLNSALMGGLAGSLVNPLRASSAQPRDVRAVYERLDHVLSQPVLKTELFPSPVMIASLELLRHGNNFLCRVRSRDGVEGIAATTNGQMEVFHPVFGRRLREFFVGKDARDLEALLEEAYVNKANYKFQSLALWVPMATIELAILDMLGRVCGRPMGDLVGQLCRSEVEFYQANRDRDISEVEIIENLRQQLAESQTKALKFKLGGRMSRPEIPAGRTERLIPLARKTFGDSMHLFADANGSYSPQEAIRIGRLLQEYNYALYEEPVPFDWYEETKQVADALDIPVAGGEQEASLWNFRWMIANDGLQVVQPDIFYFGGMIRSMRVARMAAVLGKDCVPHISASGLGFLYLMHFISAVPNAGRFHEFKGENKDIPLECKTASLKIVDGVMKIPTGPGAGIDIDPDFIRKHEVISG
jgi:L-alanine-DL-glutamate epimerase-like enolase superfamily enzyme